MREGKKESEKGRKAEVERTMHDQRDVIPSSDESFEEVVGLQKEKNERER